MTTPTITRVVGALTRFSYPQPRVTPTVAVDPSWRRPAPVAPPAVSGADYSCGDYLKYEEQD